MNGRSGWVCAVVVLVIVSWAGQVPASPAPPQNSSENVGRWPYGPVDAVAESGGQLVFGSGCVLLIAEVSGTENCRGLFYVGETPGGVEIVQDCEAVAIDEVGRPQSTRQERDQS